MKSKRAAKEAAAASEGDKPIADAILNEQSVRKRKRSGDDDGETKGTSVKKSKKDKKDKEKSKDKKKSKKDKSETRKEKKEKRKNLQDLPEVDAEDDEAEGVAAGEKKEQKKEKTSKAESKVNGAEDGEDKKKKKERKEKKEKKQNGESKPKKDSNKAEPTDSEHPTSEEKTNGAPDAIDLDASSARKPGRNIVFVGNLPYTATAASITAHFAALKPIAVRCLTDKGGDAKVTCKGIAFVEFGSPLQQRTCLDKFHHSMFEDGISAARKINVELTAGGGGKNQNRQDKIRQKNQKLDENRQKRIENEKQEKLENSGGTKQQQQQQQQAMMEDSIHPSRLARLPGLGR